jgi:hypothetical protein
MEPRPVEVFEIGRVNNLDTFNLPIICEAWMLELAVRAGSWAKRPAHVLGHASA